MQIAEKTPWDIDTVSGSAGLSNLFTLLAKVELIAGGGSEFVHLSVGKAHGVGRQDKVIHPPGSGTSDSQGVVGLRGMELGIGFNNRWVLTHHPRDPSPYTPANGYIHPTYPLRKYLGMGGRAQVLRIP